MALPHGSDPRSRRARKASHRGALAPGPGWWLAVAVSAGMFAMHGLGMHGAHFSTSFSATHSESGSTAAGMTAPATPATGHDAGAVIADPIIADLNAFPFGSATDKSPEPSGGAGLVGLCLTLLVFGMPWLRRWTRGRPALTIPRRALAARIVELLVTARNLSPPVRAELSIWRC